MNFGRNPGAWVVILAVVTAWNIYDMASATETPSTGYSLLNWGLLIGGGGVLIAAIVQFMQQKMRGRS